MKNLLLIACVLVTTLFGCQSKVVQSAFVTTDGAQFVKEGKPYYFVGTNYWYGGILGSVGEGGDRERLIQELDMMQEHGIDNLRILAGAEGPNNEPFRVTPALQMAPGVYNDTILDGLDFLLNEMGKRNMSAVLFLNNTWEWSGGYAQYLNWAGFGAIPYPQIAPHSWPEFMAFSSQFHSSEVAMQMYRDHIKFMLSRTNRYSGLKYTEDPAIMTWEIANEPRALSVENKANFSKWIEETADYIKSIDANHLVTTGTEGLHGCEEDMALFETIHSNVSVDYLTMHIWPNNWGWIDNKRIVETLDSAIGLTKAYMAVHIAVAQKLNKPIVFEEFGLPRDHHLFSLDDPTTARDKYYAYAFAMVEKSARDSGALAGSNFWAFGGTGRHWRDDPYWQAGDDLMGDPPQEEQGLNSVFDTDSTMGLIKEHSLALKKMLK
ncbi:MAG: cellulase family glycosylhydrolase [Bacteroidales bacterium]|jgi:mannan endo-1,4-beta-mannosidase|nr:cellulase family glycosylhydrolase [Bacteroidales bacterium]